MYDHEKSEKWDFCPCSHEEESFISWFTRLAKSNCSDVGMLYLKLVGNIHNSIKSLNKNEIDKHIYRLQSSKTFQDGLKKILSDFINIDSYSTPKLALENLSNSESNGKYLLTQQPTPKFCPYCLKMDEIPYYRHQWFYKFITYCDIHKCLLFERCPRCYSPIKFWQTQWDDSIITCFNCGSDITQDIDITHQIKSDYQSVFYDIIKTKTYKGKKINPIKFFQDFWRVTQIVSLDPQIKEEENISIDRLFTALNSAKKYVESDEKRLETPYNCPYDGKQFSNEIDLDLHINHEHNQKMINDPAIIERYQLIKPFIEKGITIKSQVIKLAAELNLPFHTAYKWVLEYKKHGIAGLAPKKRVKGKRSSRFSDETYQILENNIASFDEDEMSIMDCWKKIVKECMMIPNNQSGIPGKSTVATRIKFLRDQNKKR
jgi:hypothetical protein